MRRGRCWPGPSSPKHLGRVPGAEGRSGGSGVPGRGRSRAAMTQESTSPSGWWPRASGCSRCRRGGRRWCGCSPAATGARPDDTDAEAIALVGRQSTDLPEVQADEMTVTLRLLSHRRDELVRLRTQAACGIHRDLHVLLPGGARRGLTAARRWSSSPASVPMTTSALCAASSRDSRQWWSERCLRRSLVSTAHRSRRRPSGTCPGAHGAAVGTRRRRRWRRRRRRRRRRAGDRVRRRRKGGQGGCRWPHPGRWTLRRRNRDLGLDALAEQ